MEQNYMEQNFESFIDDGISAITGNAGAVKVVALERAGEDQITLSFFCSGSSWGLPARQISLDIDLAEQLRKMLKEELEGVSSGAQNLHHPKYLATSLA